MRRAFGASLPTDEELVISREITEFDRTLAFFDGPEMVATAGIFSYGMTVPGGTLPCGEITAYKEIAESELVFNHENFNHCAEIAPPGLVVAPLKLVKGSGSPCRALALVQR